MPFAGGVVGVLQDGEALELTVPVHVTGPERIGK